MASLELLVSVGIHMSPGREEGVYAGFCRDICRCHNSFLLRFYRSVKDKYTPLLHHRISLCSVHLSALQSFNDSSCETHYFDLLYVYKTKRNSYELESWREQFVNL